MTSATEPPDRAIRQILDQFHTGNMDLDQACHDLTQTFGRHGDDLARHLGVLLEDVRRHRITVDEASRDLIRAATAARKGDPHFLALLAPVHA